MRAFLIAVVVLVAAVFVVTTCVDWANAGGDYHPLTRGGYGTFYDETTSVFCATRTKAVSCVYVPRDTVRRGE